MHLPNVFVTNIRNAFQEEGDQFLKDLPSLIDEAAARWGLRDVQPVENLSFHYVAGAVQDGREVIVKIGVPNPELTSQIEALRQYDGNGACQVYDADAERGMLLLERLRPGRMLSDLENDEQATAIAAELALQLWARGRIDGVGDKYILLQGWFDDMLANLHRIEGLLPQRMIDRATGIVRERFTRHEAGSYVLLHGDFHHYNILESDRGWQIIDPKGVIGPAGYEVGPFLINPFDLLDRPDPVRVTERRIAILADALGFERETVRDWGFAHAVLSDYWCVEDEGAGDGELFRCAEVIAQARI